MSAAAMPSVPGESAMLACAPTLLVDAQATGASPRHGHLMELGWCWLPHGVGAPSAPILADEAAPEVVASFLALPEGAQLPTRVARITGIDPADLVGAPAPEQLWRALLDALSVASQPVLCVVHYARFEEPFLRALHARVAPGSDFPLELVCTHELARRLLPDLPRRGMRALAGYFGDPMPPGKRVATHVHATWRIWRHLLALASEQGIERRDPLAALLGAAAPRPGKRRPYRVAPQVRLALPDAPGVYHMLGRGGQILYVGKATSLKQRVNSYFRSRKGGAQQTLEMLTQVWDVQVTTTASALEAALLEVDEIKKHDPIYNVALREAARSVAFASRGWTLAETRSPQHPVGPLIGDTTWPALRTLVALLENTINAAEDLAAELTDLDPEQGLATVAEARALLVKRLGSEHLGFGLVMRRGRQWAQERALEAARERASGDTDDDGDEDIDRLDHGPRPWTPERLEAHFEGLIRHASGQVRRGRWLTLLANSVLSWSLRGSESRRWLRVVGGVIDARGAGAAPAPTARRRPVRELGLCFDVPTYDRLRVLTTELRRLLSEGREPQLHTVRHTLHGDQLARVLATI